MSLENLNQALINWQEKLSHFERELSISANPSQKFELQKRIQECEQEIQRLKKNKDTLKTDIAGKAVKEILPEPFEWCYIPSGNVNISHDWYDYSENVETYKLEDYYISKYPITYGQYQVFFSSSTGYSNDEWWESDDRKDLSDHHDQRVEKSLIPAQVTRYAAFAFCRWLSRQVLYTIVVPSESHWLRSAQGDDGRKYPWGNDFNPLKCNSGLSGIGSLTPVTRYKNGASPYGVCDLSGNSPEWFVLTVSKPLPKDEKIEEDVSYSEMVKYYYSEMYGYGSVKCFHQRQKSDEHINLYEVTNPDHFRCIYRGDSASPYTTDIASFRICIPSSVYLA